MTIHNMESVKDLYMEYEFPLEEVTKCLVCHSKECQYLFLGQDDRYHYKGMFPVVQCLSCNLVYLKNRVSAESIPLLYTKYYGLKKKRTNKIGIIEKIKNKVKRSPIKALFNLSKAFPTNLYQLMRVNPGIRILDVGSGEVLPEAFRIIRAGGFWIGVEIDQTICQALAKAGLPTYLGSLEEFYKTRPEKFDCIILSQILEHIYDPREFLNVARKLLRSGGKIVLSCPNYDSFLRQRFGQRWLHWHIPYHVTQYNYNSLNYLATSAGLKMSKFQTVTPANWFWLQSLFSDRFPSFNCIYPMLIRIPFIQKILDSYFAKKNDMHLGDAIVSILSDTTRSME